MIAILLYICAGVCKALSDAIAHGKIKYTGEWWSNSGAAKWKNGDPAQGEAFLFSSTLLVWSTDFWHLFNMFQYLCFWLAIPAFYYQGPVFSVAWDMGILFVVFRGVFEVCYRWVFVKR